MMLLVALPSAAGEFSLSTALYMQAEPEMLLCGRAQYRRISHAHRVSEKPLKLNAFCGCCCYYYYYGARFFS